MALKRLIQPLAGEYGMHNGEPQGALGWQHATSKDCSSHRPLPAERMLDTEAQEVCWLSPGVKAVAHEPVRLTDMHREVVVGKQHEEERLLHEAV